MLGRGPMEERILYLRFTMNTNEMEMCRILFLNVKECPIMRISNRFKVLL
jgi:hypothetical protein